MARITIEDCIEKVPNRFQLVQMAAIRAKQLKKGAHALLKSDENKEVVTSLREIAAGYVSPGDGAEAGDPESLFDAPLSPVTEAPLPPAPAPSPDAAGEEEPTP